MVVITPNNLVGFAYNFHLFLWYPSYPCPKHNSNLDLNSGWTLLEAHWTIFIEHAGLDTPAWNRKRREKKWFHDYSLIPYLGFLNFRNPLQTISQYSA